MGERTITLPKLPARSMGLKLLLVCVLALLMWIPSLFVSNLVRDRANRASGVAAELGQIVGGPQVFLGPVLAVPYLVPSETANTAPTRDVFLIFPTHATGVVTTTAQTRQRGLFKTPVWTADLTLNSSFDVAPSMANLPARAQLDWQRAEFLVGAANTRGAQADATLTINGQVLPLAPAANLVDLALRAAPVAAEPGVMRSYMVREPMPGDGDLRFFGVLAAGIAGPDAKLDAGAKLKFSGAERLAVLAWGKTTELTVSGAWPSPSFDGGFLPVSREVSDQGFKARWSIPFIARGVPAEGSPVSLSRLGETELGVSFVEQANPYQSVSRSLKYALMFVGLVFLAFFLFETMAARRVHPAQYVLIGLAQCVFYLLLLSIAERIGFDAAFLVAAVATVGLISAYAGWVFESRKRGLIALAAFSALYALIYVLMRLEDFALLVGAVTSFAAIAAVMYLTRRIDWYGATALRDPFEEPKDKA